MFCYLEQLELQVTTCPVKCMYRNAALQCGYADLTPDTDDQDLEVNVTASQISVVKGLKLYKVKSELAVSRERIRVGLATLRYSEFLKARKDSAQDLAVDGIDHRQLDQQVWLAPVEALLLEHFGLGVEHRVQFFQKQVFKEWKSTIDLGFPLTLGVVIDTLISIAVPNIQSKG